MTLGQNDQRVQAPLLHRGGEEQRRVQTRRKPAVQDRGGSPDLLSIALETGGRQGIAQVQIGDRGPQRRCQFVNPRALSGVVTVDVTGPSGTAQGIGSRLQKPVDGGVVRHDERGEQFGHRARPAPLVGGEQFDWFAMIRDHFPIGIDQAEGHRAAFAFGQPLRVAGVDVDPPVQQVQRLASRDAVDVPSTLGQEWRVGYELERHSLEDLVGLVDDRDRAYRRNGILL